MYEFGVDEAGKGPAFGSMFAASVCVEDRERLPEGIADSKRLTPARREELAAALRTDEEIHVGVAEISTGRIDDPTTNMNGLAVTAHANAIEAAVGALENWSQSGDAPLTGLCDACDTDADRFARRVADACSLEATVDAKHGADDDSALVGAASIIAKVERDAHVAELATEFGEIGSGYPGDPGLSRVLRRRTRRVAAVRSRILVDVRGRSRGGESDESRRVLNGPEHEATRVGENEQTKSDFCSLLVRQEPPQDVAVGGTGDEHADQHAENRDDREPAQVAQTEDRQWRHRDDCRRGGGPDDPERLAKARFEDALGVDVALGHHLVGDDYQVVHPRSDDRDEPGDVGEI